MFQQQEQRPVYVCVSVVKRCGVVAVMKVQESSNKKAKTNSPLIYMFMSAFRVSFGPLSVLFILLMTIFVSLFMLSLFSSRSNGDIFMVCW